MGLLSFLAPAKRAARTAPHTDRTPLAVTLRRTNRDQPVEEFAPADPHTVALIRQHLPNAEAPSPNLKACRHSAVLDREAAFLADTSGTIEPPERWEVIDACRFAAEALRDAVVIS